MIKKTIILLLVALVFVIGYVLGGIQVGVRVAKNSDIAALMWITSIDQLLQQGKTEKAKKICFDAAKIHFFVLKSIDDKPWMMIVDVFPWMYSNFKEINRIILTRSKTYYLPRATEMDPAARSYLESIKEVPIPPSSCNKQTENGYTTTPTSSPK